MVKRYWAPLSEWKPCSKMRLCPSILFRRMMQIQFVINQLNGRYVCVENAITAVTARSPLHCVVHLTSILNGMPGWRPPSLRLRLGPYWNCVLRILMSSFVSIRMIHWLAIVLMLWTRTWEPWLFTTDYATVGSTRAELPTA